MTEPLEQWITERGEVALWERFSRESLEQGERLLRDQSVLDCSPGGQGFFARVQADRRQVVSVDCRIHPLPSPLPVTCYCSCAEGEGCAHAVAAILHYLGRTAPACLKSHNPAIQHWLAELEVAAACSPDAHIGECLIYLLEQADAGAIVCTPKRVRRRRDGSYGRLMPFAGVRRAPPELLQPVDRRILRLLGEPGTALPPDDLAFLLDLLTQTHRAHWQSPQNPPLQKGIDRPGQLVWQPNIEGGQRLVLQAEETQLLTPRANPPVWIDPVTHQYGGLQIDIPPRVVDSILDAPEVGAEDLPALARALGKATLPVPAPSAPRRRRMNDVKPVPALRLTRLEDPTRVKHSDWTQAVAEFGFDYGGHQIAGDWAGDAVCEVVGGQVIEYRRDKAAEETAFERLKSMGLSPLGCLTQGRMAAESVSEWRRFVAEKLPMLQAEGWNVEVEPRFPWRLVEGEQWQVGAWQRERQPDWFEFDLSVEVDGERHAILPRLLALIRDNPEGMTPKALEASDAKGHLLLDLDDGRMIAVPNRWLQTLLKGLTELYDPALHLRDGRLALPMGRAALLEALERMAPEQAIDWQGDQSIRALGTRLAAIEDQPPAPTPKGLRGELRPYQQVGVSWLQYLARSGLGGVLADDMGLGKTLQVIVHLLLEKESGRAQAPSLIVVPTSLLFNWEREIERFAPGLSVLRLHGPQRHAITKAASACDVVLTTYGLLVRDIDVLAQRRWHLVVLDEAQAVKNPRAQAARAVRRLVAQQRLSLTGTPLENHLGELWAQFDFVAPGLLGNAAAFKRVYRRPIEQGQDEQRLQTLRERVAPFILRRTKQAIASDLPEKTEMPLYAELVGRQRDLYQQLLAGQQLRVQEALAASGRPQSRMVVLDALLKLREVCCDPRLVSGAEASASGPRESVKLDLLLDLVDELRQADRRVLIFSQFTRMLEIIEDALRQRDHQWVKLTGATRDREGVVNQFQRGEVPLFLISLKAGGTGLNLTAADTVIHYDPWWNPAVARQATDRAHRIGQHNPVFVYHLLTRGTVEDRMMELQQEKADLSARLLGDGALKAMDPLDPSVVESLFAPLPDLSSD